ncbi:MAG: RelA/SpoT domain-containing protein [Nitrosomonas sp.]|nr:RelA/SpoT domain-containing protein [Nitrosomonas sp.]MDP1950728.1 RelA/SpoT domain-containing protein [Nitrosomonas sp.]
MNFDEYEKRYFSLYAEFAKTVRLIVEHAMAAIPGLPMLQSIQARAKVPDRLKSRLKEKSLLESQHIEDERKDLAGIRLIFYTNTDVDRFLDSRLIFENFDIEHQATKIHHPTKENERTRYQAIHYVVRLKEERTNLPEYAKYKGLRCEIQIQTILNHAWSETSHDPVYQECPRDGFGKKAMDAITQRFNDIMDKYLMPAGYEFQRVQHDYERLQQGKELFDRGAISAILNAKDNNERCDLLITLKDVALPNYDDIPVIYGDLCQPLIDVASKARSTAVVPIETPFGALKGKKSPDVLRLIVNIFDMLKYVDVERTFNAFCKLFVEETDSDIQNQILVSIKHLAKYDLHAWRQVGPQVQFALSGQLAKIPQEKHEALRSILLTVWGELLSSDISGTTWNADSVTIHSGAVTVSDMLGKIRARAMKGLFSLIKSATSDADKNDAFSALDNATRLPNQTAYTDELLALSLNDAKRIVDFMIQEAPSLSYEVLQHQEYRLLWEYRRSLPLADGEVDKRHCRREAKALLESIKTFRDQINTDNDYVHYKTLVGYESVFPSHWVDEEFDIEGVDQYRHDQIKSFVESITPKNEQPWFKSIERCASAKCNDLATFHFFEEFLVALSKKKPEIAERYIKVASKDLLSFLPAFLKGAFESGYVKIHDRIVGLFLGNSSELSAIAKHWRNCKPVQPAVIKQIIYAAIEESNDIAVIECLLFAMEEAGSQKVPPRDEFFLLALRYLTDKKDARWVRGGRFLQTTQSFFDSLNSDDAKLLLDNLIYFPKVDYQLERVLGSIAKHQLQLVWSYFGLRLTHEDKVEAENDEKLFSDKYEAVPYEFHGLQKHLSQDSKAAVSNGREWFARDSRLFRFGGGRLLSAAFPTFNCDFAATLIELIDEGNAVDADFVLEIMQNYHGESSTHEVLKRIIDKYPKDNSKLSRVKISLDSAGVVRGEFGMVEAYRSKKEAITSWLSDEQKNVREFARTHIAELERQIIAEQKRADEGIAMKRSQFDAGDDA